MTKRALTKFNYLDYQTYLKTPLVFGFHGVYKRLALHLRLVDNDLRPGNGIAKRLGDAWAKETGAGEYSESNEYLERWRIAVKKALAQSPVRTKNVFTGADWESIATMFAPHTARSRERRVLREALLNEDPETALGALRHYWAVYEDKGTEEEDERIILRAVSKRATEYSVLIDAIEHYENFARAMTNAFDIIRLHASKQSSFGAGFVDISKDTAFSKISTKLPDLYRKAEAALHEIGGWDMLFAERFLSVSDPLPAADAAAVLCAHHERVQREKSVTGKNPWFDRVGNDRVVMRRSYALSEPPTAPLDAFVHFYRCNPIRRFFRDLQ